eukprot:10583993-Alexandrium_andersonii.AAC.1
MTSSQNAREVSRGSGLPGDPSRPPSANSNKHQGWGATPQGPERGRDWQGSGSGRVRSPCRELPRG